MKKDGCGKCGWQRKLICLNPKAPRCDQPVNIDTKPCGLYHEVRK